MKQVSATNTHFTIRFDYDQTLVEIVKAQLPGRRWDKESKLWTVPLNLASSQKLWEVLGGRGFDFTLEAAEANKRLQGNLEASRAIDTLPARDREIPCPEGLAYKPFQKVGIGFAADKQYVLNADPPGTGKTIQTIGVINLFPEIRTALVVCRASGKVTWPRELERWLTRPMTVGVCQGSEWPEGNPDIVVINYDILTRFRQQLRARTWDLLVLDECQKIKNKKADRTTEVYGDFKTKVPRIPSRHTIWLTGSPSLNGRPIEMWSMLRDAGVFTNWQEYVVRYCAGHKKPVKKKWILENGRRVFAGMQESWDVSGASNLEELQAILRSSGFMIRRKKLEVIPELAEPRRQVVELPVSGIKALLDQERDVYEAREGLLADLQLAIEKAKVSESTESYIDAVKSLKMGVGAVAQEMSSLRREMAEAMIPAAIEFIGDVLENEEKLVVFGHHQSVVDAVAKAFKSCCVKMRGGATTKQRQDAVDRFQTDPKVKLFVGSIGAASDTITLTAASRIIFVEDSWVPEDLNQAESRINRMGQTVKGIYAQYLVLRGSLGATIAKTRVHKQENVNLLLDDEISLGAIPVLPVEGEPATAGVSRQRITAESLGLTAEEILRIHQEVRCLASLCDGARTRDSQGFNAFDAKFGKWLAAAPQLSPKMAAAAKTMLVKYRGQLESGRPH